MAESHRRGSVGTPYAGARADLLRCFEAGVAAVSGRRSVAAKLRSSWRGERAAVVAVGKAAADMYAGALEVLQLKLHSALLVTKRGHLGGLASAPGLRLMEASPPVPDQSSLDAGDALLDFVAELPDTLPVLFLTSGGASSLVEVLAPSAGRGFLAELNQWLLGSGLAIGEVNRIRKRLSCIKGGRLAAYMGKRRVRNLLICDVPNDDLRAIGSGLLIPHSPQDLDVSDFELPAWVSETLRTPPPLAPLCAFSNIESEIVAGPADARRAAATAARRAGYTVYESDTLVTGDAAEAGRFVAATAMAGDPGMHVWSSETTVELPPQPGAGGRCQHLALGAAIALEGQRGLVVLAAGSDGTDGPGDYAGAVVDGDTLARGRAGGHDPAECLNRADSGTFLGESADLLRTGPTGTNVMDLLLALKLS